MVVGVIWGRQMRIKMVIRRSFIDERKRFEFGFGEIKIKLQGMRIGMD